jgi:predicted DNA-binding transcriptional regulator AlpA|tara:strand:+ start:264 stop:521 length:258 start_codon:yes stop_codon:yes gene_type:complete
MDEVKIPPALVDVDQMAKIIGMSKSSIRSIMRTDDKFPKPIVFSPRIRRWKVSDIEKWYSKMTGEKPLEIEEKKKRKYTRKPKVT